MRQGKNCSRVQRRLKAWLDDELAPRTAAEIEAHVDGCPACGQRAAEFRHLGNLLRRADPGPVPRARVNLIRERAVRASEEAERTIRFLQRAAVAAAAVLVVSLSVAALPLVFGTSSAPLDAELTSQQALETAEQDAALAAFLAGIESTPTLPGEGDF